MKLIAVNDPVDGALANMRLYLCGEVRKKTTSVSLGLPIIQKLIAKLKSDDVDPTFMTKIDCAFMNSVLPVITIENSPWGCQSVDSRTSCGALFFVCVCESRLHVISSVQS